MAKKTKKVKSAGRFGPRYGRTVRKRLIKVEEQQRKKQTCPYCAKKAVKRITVGIWHCTKCKKKFTGKAYTPR